MGEDQLPSWKFTEDFTSGISTKALVQKQRIHVFSNNPTLQDASKQESLRIEDNQKISIRPWVPWTSIFQTGLISVMKVPLCVYVNEREDTHRRCYKKV